MPSPSPRSVNTEDDDTQQDQATNLDAATVDFLNEVAATRCLKVSGSGKQLSTMDFVEYLDINLLLEPELVWIAREMCGAPMPPNAEMLISKSSIVYFHDIENDYYTLEHPLTQRYLKILERQRLDIIVLRSKPSVQKLVFSQPDILFHMQFKHLQIPCQDCGVLQSTVHCDQCMMSFCQACFDHLHSYSQGPRKNHTTYQTAVGSLCSSCNKKKPQVCCANCEDYFCFPCFEAMHRKGFRTDHKAMLVSASDGDTVQEHRKCEECRDQQAAFKCDFCLDDFCVSCFWRCHLNGNRRKHTVSKCAVNPLCTQCRRTRATVFCEQCQELMCTDCFTFIHYKGGRQLHLFVDSWNVLLLLEKMDPAVVEHMNRTRPKVLWALTVLQGWTRGVEARKQFRRRRDLVTKIQRRWRGSYTRKKLLGMLDHFKWRKKQISNYFLPKTRQERVNLKQKFSSQYAKKEVASKTTDQVLNELKQAVLLTAEANPLEDATRTSQTLNRTSDAADDVLAKGSTSQSKQTIKKQQSGTTLQPETTRMLLSTEDTGKNLLSAAFNAEQQSRKKELSTLEAKDARDLTVRQLLKIDDRVDPLSIEDRVYQVGKKQNKDEGADDVTGGVKKGQKSSSFRQNSSQSNN